MQAKPGSWVAAALAALTLALGACVAETGEGDDDVPLERPASAARLTPALPKDPAGRIQQGPSGNGNSTGPAEVAPVSPCTPVLEPEPSSWKPGNNSQNH
jgi:hypothetical protein